jgi:hypothetical protein
MIDPKDLATREGALAFFEHTKGMLLGEFARNGEIRPHAIVFVGKSPDSGEWIRDRDGNRAVGLGFVFADALANNRHKDGFAFTIAEFIDRTHACGVLMVMESWMATAAKRSDAPSDLSKPFPGRREGIVVTLEHVAFEKPILACSLIERSASGKGYAKPFEASPFADVEGRFAHLLKRSAS